MPSRGAATTQSIPSGADLSAVTMSQASPDTKGRTAAGERSLDVAAALQEAKLRGLPDGWKVSIDVSPRLTSCRPVVVGLVSLSFR